MNELKIKRICNINALSSVLNKMKLEGFSIMEDRAESIYEICYFGVKINGDISKEVYITFDVLRGELSMSIKEKRILLTFEETYRNKRFF